MGRFDTATESLGDSRNGLRGAQIQVNLPPSFHGVHVAPLQMAHDKIAWIAPMARCNRVRVRRHTCDCKATIYELCASGGLMLVRRTVRAPEGAAVRESAWLVTAKAAHLRRLLLLGHAR
ncbi:hypothetical protein [Planotetraspora sp. GP83]|uniref:hypothetical protein n=1 Tax=Planotetraspora sp. GP83 TaxID=3156264 RepID=UPI00351212E6